MAADQTADLIQKISLEPKAKGNDVSETTKKVGSAKKNGGVPNALVPPYERSITPLLDYMDGSMCYLPNGYPSSPYYYGGIDGSINEWEDYYRYLVAEGLEIPPGFYGDIYHHGYGYAPYAPYSSPATLGPDGQLYGHQHYQFPAPYYQPLAPANAPQNANQRPNSKGEVSTSVAADQPLISTETAKASTFGTAKANTNGNNGSVKPKLNVQNQSFNSNGSFTGVVSPGGLPASGFEDPRFGFDGLWSPLPWFDGSVFPDGHQRPATTTTVSSAASHTNHTSSRNQNNRSLPHLMIQLLADLNLRKTPQLVELVDDSKDVEELMGLGPEKLLLKWMNFHLKKAGYEKTVTNFSSDVKDGEAYAHLLNALAPEHSTTAILDTKDPNERAKIVLEQAEKLDCKRYISAKDIVEGSANLNLAFVAQIFQHRNGLSTDTKQVPLTQMVPDDIEVSRQERSFRLWLNSLGTATYINNLFEDLRNGWVLLEVLDKVSPGSVNWKHASKPPIKLPFRKVENCNQVIKIGKQLKLSLINIAGSDIVQGNKKLILAFLWQLMRFNILQLLKNLRFHSQGKEITDADILIWANGKVKTSGRTSKAESFKDRSLSTGIFFLELLSAVEPRVVNWKLVTKGESDEEKKLNATYIISVARKLGCAVFLLPEDIMEVNQKMILTLIASIMYWSLQRPGGDSEPQVTTEVSEPSAEDAMSQTSPSDSEEGSVVADNVSTNEEGSLAADSISNLTIEDATVETSSFDDDGIIKE